MKKPESNDFAPLSLDELADVLGLTIKQDRINKLITFLCQLSAYTEESQFNLSYNAPSSTGKSYIPIEISQLFPEEDIVMLGYCSPMAFFHDVGEWDKVRKQYIVNLSRKILIFLDQPHTELLGRLRPLLSHDKKEISLKVTDKNEKYGLRTKNILIRGYPAVIFCTAGLRVDEQEATRFILLSPEGSQEKLRQAIHSKIKREVDISAYREWLESDSKRKVLRERLRAIKKESIADVKINFPEKIEEAFLHKSKFLRPRDTRDVGRAISLVKCIALLNLWFREREGSTIVANGEDVQEGLNLWEAISETQELNLPPYVFEIYKDVILPIWEENNKYSESKGGVGVQRKEILKKYREIYNRPLPDWQLRQQILPMMEDSGLIYQEPDISDRRRVLIYPTLPLTTFSTISPPTPSLTISENQLPAALPKEADFTPENVTDVESLRAKARQAIEEGHRLCPDQAREWASRNYLYGLSDLNRMENHLRRWDGEAIEELKSEIDRYLEKAKEITRRYHQGW